MITTRCILAILLLCFVSAVSAGWAAREWPQKTHNYGHKHDTDEHDYHQIQHKKVWSPYDGDWYNPWMDNEAIQNDHDRAVEKWGEWAWKNLGMKDRLNPPAHHSDDMEEHKEEFKEWHLDLDLGKLPDFGILDSIKTDITKQDLPPVDCFDDLQDNDSISDLRAAINSNSDDVDERKKKKEADEMAKEEKKKQAEIEKYEEEKLKKKQAEMEKYEEEKLKKKQIEMEKKEEMMMEEGNDEDTIALPQYVDSRSKILSNFDDENQRLGVIDLSDLKFIMETLNFGEEMLGNRKWICDIIAEPEILEEIDILLRSVDEKEDVQDDEKEEKKGEEEIEIDENEEIDDDEGKMEKEEEGESVGDQEGHVTVAEPTVVEIGYPDVSIEVIQEEKVPDLFETMNIWELVRPSLGHIPAVSEKEKVVESDSAENNDLFVFDLISSTAGGVKGHTRSKRQAAEMYSSSSIGGGLLSKMEEMELKIYFSFLRAFCTA